MPSFSKNIPTQTVPVTESTAVAAWVTAIGISDMRDHVLVATSYASNCLPTSSIGPVKPPNVYNLPLATNLLPSARSDRHAAALRQVRFAEMVGCVETGVGLGAGVVMGGSCHGTNPVAIAPATICANSTRCSS